MAARRETAGKPAASSVGTDGREALRTLSDKPLEDDTSDRLDFAAYADALAELLDHPDTDTPLTIAISAQWGAGKTSLARMVEARLKKRPTLRGDSPHITCWFNAWLHDDAPHLGAAFAAEVAKTAERYRPIWRRILSPLPSAMLSPEERWRRRLGIAVMSFILALVVALLPGSGEVLRGTFAPNADVLDRLQELFGSTGVGAAILFLVAFAFSRRVFTIAQAAARFIDDPKSEAAKGSMQDVSAQLRQLIEQATQVRPHWLIIPRPARRFVIFVDDLERCRPPRSVEVCEVASQLLGHPNVLTVLIADMTTIATSAEIKYAALEHMRGSSGEGSKLESLAGTYGRLYLQKIVQIQFNLPPSPVDSMPGLLTESIQYSPSSDPLNRLRPQSRLVRYSPSSDPLNRLGPQSRLVRILTSIGAIFIVLWLFRALVVIAFDDANQSTNASPLPRWSVGIFGVVSVIFIGRFLWNFGRAVVRDYQTWRTRQEQRWIDHEIRQAVNGGAATVDEVMAVIVGQGLRLRYQELARQRAQRMLTDDSARRTQAESEIREYLPPLPRSAKRLFNHLRVLLVVAEQKHMFGGHPELQARHLGKWAVLLERWPEFGSALTADPGRLADLEAATSIEELSKQLGPLVPTLAVSQDLLDFLKSPTKLAPVVERLVYFRPSDSGQDVEARSDALGKVVEPISPASES
jgi:hypothetical protein